MLPSGLVGGVVSAYIIRMQSSLTGACLVGLTRCGHCALNVGHPIGETGLGFDFLVESRFLLDLLRRGASKCKSGRQKVVACGLYCVLWLALVVLGMGWGNADYVESVLLFVDIPSLVLVFVGTIAFTLATHTWREVVSALGAGLSEQTVSAEEAAEHIATLKTGRGFALGLGGIGALIGLVGMLASLEDPAAIGPAMAISLLSTFYGVFIAEICLAPHQSFGGSNPEVHPNAPMATANRRASAGSRCCLWVVGAHGVASGSFGSARDRCHGGHDGAAIGSGRLDRVLGTSKPSPCTARCSHDGGGTRLLDFGR